MWAGNQILTQIGRFLTSQQIHCLKGRRKLNWGRIVKKAVRIFLNERPLSLQMRYAYQQALTQISFFSQTTTSPLPFILLIVTFLPALYPVLIGWGSSPQPILNSAWGSLICFKSFSNFLHHHLKFCCASQSWTNKEYSDEQAIPVIVPSQYICIIRSYCTLARIRNCFYSWIFFPFFIDYQNLRITTSRPPQQSDHYPHA